VVILAPNEEICLEIKFFADLFGDFMNVKNTCNYEVRGGTGAGSQENKMYTGVDIAIVTPKRFLDAILDEETNVSRVNTVVFDEMDKICDTGYGSTIVDNVMSKLPKNLLTAVFSSTLPLDVRIFIEEHCRSPNFVQLSVADAHLTRTPLQMVQQHVHVCEKDDKTIMLYHLLKSILADTRSPNKKTLVFVEEQFYPISEFLLDKGLPVLALIDMASDTQRYILNKFKDPKCNQIMVTRSKIFHGPGMQIPGLKYVVNVDFPRTFVPAASYIYQVSRAGHLANNEKGVAHTFMTLTDARKSQEVVDILRECDQVGTISPIKLHSIKLISTCHIWNEYDNMREVLV
jgi:ATP-dependent RNA helicase DeaD